MSDDIKPDDSQTKTDTPETPETSESGPEPRSEPESKPKSESESGPRSAAKATGAEDEPGKDAESKDAESKDAQSKPDESKPDESKTGGYLGTVLFAVLFVAVLVGGYALGQKIQEWRRGPVQVDDEVRYKVSLRGDEPQRGPDDALVTVIEFSDFQCPFCAKAAVPLEQAASSWGDDVRVIFKHYPLPGHVNALPAAKVAWAADKQDKFWEVHDWLFETGGKIDDLPAIVEKLGLDGEKLGADMASDAAATAVDDDRLSGGRVGISGTPAFVVNGHIYKGARSRSDWNQIIRIELAAAREVEKSGVPRAQVYDKLMESAETSRGAGGAESSAARAKKRRPGEPFPDQAYRVEPGPGRPQLGPDDALVTVVEFSDFDCPFCAKAAPVIKALADKYGDDMRLVFRQHPLPMHPYARDAARASLAAHRQGKFWAMHDALFADDEAKTRDDYVRLAEAQGLDPIRFGADFDDEAIGTMIAEDEAVAKQFGAVGTPAFFINGRFLSGAHPPSVFESIIDEELAKARGLVDGGVPRAEVFAKIMAEAHTEVIEPE